MSTQVTISLLQQPAEVRINQRTGSIIFSGNVEISPVAVSHKNLMITTLTPPPVPTAQNPQRIRDTMVALDTAGRNREKARIQDLLLAFRTLDVPWKTGSTSSCSCTRPAAFTPGWWWSNAMDGMNSAISMPGLSGREG